MGIKDNEMFDRLRDECDLKPYVVEGRGEFMLEIEGPILNNARFKEIMEREPGTYGHYFLWFQTAEQRAAYRADLQRLVDAQCAPDKALINEKQGIEFMTRPKIWATLNYKGKEYEVTDIFTYGYDPDTALYYWGEGNLSCDCNRRLWIEKFYPGTVPEDEEVCGDTIECTKFRVELID